ncbi:MAG: FGGY-family carbohydrate kinase [Thiohalomonadaceae bacterium]
MKRNDRTLAVGIDFGTSGCRAIAIDRDAAVQAEVHLPLPPPVRHGVAVEQEPSLWAAALETLLDRLGDLIPAERIGAIAVDGTSGTVLLADATGAPLGPALMYNDGRATVEAATIAAVAPRESAAHGTAAGLAKLLWLLKQPGAEQAAYLLTQADYLNGLLGGQWGISDANNCLKNGYDAHNRDWPGWLDQLGVPRHLLPQVVTPGTVIGQVRPAWCQRHGFASDTVLAAGTTDSTAAFLATGAAQPGEAVTSLGSTLVLKVISERPIHAPEYGVYSQPLGNRWLVGGGSNSGGAVLRQFFTDAAMAALTPRLRPEQPTGLDYYPLPAPGERFPVCDPALPPRLTPRPDDDAVFFQGLLEGIARIEQRGYQLLAELGAPWPVSVRTVGGGAHNTAWTKLRQALLQVPMPKPRHTQAAYGTALLARAAVNPSEEND